jgi:hypothetical protein
VGMDIPSVGAIHLNSLHAPGKSTSSSSENEEDASTDHSTRKKRHFRRSTREPTPPRGTVHTPTASQTPVYQALQSSTVTHAEVDPDVASWPHKASVASIKSAFIIEELSTFNYEVPPISPSFYNHNPCLLDVSSKPLPP